MKRGFVLRPDYESCGSLQHFASFPASADDTENHHSGTPPLQFLGKDKSGVVLQLRLLWQHRPREPCRNANSDHRAKAGGMRLDSVHLSMLVIGVSFACYSPSLNSLQDQAYKSAVVIEGKVQSTPVNVSAEPYRVNVKVLDVWPLNSGGLEREQLVTVGEFGSEAPCTKVKKNHKYIFFMDPTDEPLVFKASFAPLDTSGKNLKKDVGKILCVDCDPYRNCSGINFGQ
ncbi:Pro-neuregulin-2, membrane-bound isoform [Channa argus]|uniref:Pro-neuregulin-2, membrane-bound isoform n=1 Tax=Channa argus TaxID=215402 RepID=A0A6G1QUW8_CHAAH|nr:Pro-neuregulin-2, membrane-bound isoform [Channa argus]